MEKMTETIVDNSTNTSAEMTDHEKNLKDLHKFVNMPFIDLYQALTESKESLEKLKSSKSMIDQVGDVSLDEGSKDINQTNMADNNKIHEEVESFYKKYEPLTNESQRVIHLLEYLVAEFGDAAKSSSYLSKSMVDSATLKYNDLKSKYDAVMNTGDPDIIKKMRQKNPSTANMDLVLKRINTIRTAYENRTDFDVLWNKLEYSHNIRKLLKEFKNDPDGCVKTVNTILAPVFNDKNMSKFRNVFYTLLDNTPDNLDYDTVSIFFMTFWLAKVYEKEYSSGKCAYVKTFIMNVYDSNLSSNIYDLEGGRELIKISAITMYTLISTLMHMEPVVPAKKFSSFYGPIYKAAVSQLNSARQKLIEKDPGTKVADTSYTSINNNFDFNELLNKIENYESKDDKIDDTKSDTKSSIPNKKEIAF